MQNQNGTSLDLAGCPGCAAPAEVVDRFALESTDGPVEHITVLCAGRHRFMMPAAHLPAARTGEEPGPWTRAA